MIRDLSEHFNTEKRTQKNWENMQINVSMSKNLNMPFHPMRGLQFHHQDFFKEFSFCQLKPKGLENKSYTWHLSLAEPGWEKREVIAVPDREIKCG